MADIFLSYAREDKERARLFARAFEAQAWSVFWDPRILPGTSWDEVIEAELEQCRCVVVLWSATSVSSKWVKSEATFGDDKGMLVPVALDGAIPPLKFRYIQSAQLQVWMGDPSDDAFAHLLEGIARHAPHPLKATPKRAGPTPRSGKPQRSKKAPSESAEAPSIEAPHRASTRMAPVSLPPRRFQDDAWCLPDEPLLGFVEIPPGEFLMGSDRSQDPQADDAESAQHQLMLSAYFMGRYEVTVGQFKACVADGGCRPGDAKSLEGAADEPVRWVTWHEALAYCTWLEEKLKAWPKTPKLLADLLAGRSGGAAWRVTLPSEAEWEKAARGTDGRIYPWGDSLGRTCANYTGTGPGKPTPVGSNPTGASPYGVLDMSGNVWEWTRSRRRAYPYQPTDGREDLSGADKVPRVVRGGSFNSFVRRIRAAYRHGREPNDRDGRVGFRVVVSPFWSGTTEAQS